MNLMQWLLKGFGQCVHSLFGIFFCTCTPNQFLPFRWFALGKVIFI
jgi:hypothetical protein